MQCPGQDSRYWDNEAIFEASCTKCGNTVEFFKDDNKRKCKKCGTEMLNPKIDFGCASYCPYAEQCLGSLPPEMIAQKQELLIDRVAIEAKKLLGQDFEKIGLMTKTARQAEKLVKESTTSNRAVVLCTCYFLPLLIDLKGVEEQQEILGRIETILKTLGANPGIIAEIKEILDDPHHLNNGTTSNRAIIHESLILAKAATTNPANE